MVTLATPIGLAPVRIAGYDAPQRAKDSAEVILGSGDDAHAQIQAALAVANEVVLSGSMNASTVMSYIAAGAGEHKRIRVDGWAKIYLPDTANPAFFLAGYRTAVTLAFSGTSLGKGGYTYSHTTTGLASTLPAGSLVEIVSTQAGPTARGGTQDFLGEMNQISRITPPTDTTVTFVEPLHDTYDLSSSTVTVYLVTPLRVHIDGGVEFIPPGGDGHPQTTSALRHTPFEARWIHRSHFDGPVARGKYARSGIAIASAYNVTGYTEAYDIRDLNASAFEGYGTRILGGSHINLKVRGGRNRHTFDAHNPTGTGLPTGQQRSIARHLTLDVEAWGDLSAAFSTHGGAQDVKAVVRAVGCSGAAVFRGRDLDLDLRGVGSKHDLGDYSTNQGYDHAVRIGEPNASDSTQGGPCGTNLKLKVAFDFTGAPSVTAHGVYAEDPLVNADIEFVGACKPTGIGLWARGDFNDNVTIRGTIDGSAQFTSTPKNAVRFDAGHPASFTKNTRLKLRDLTIVNGLRDTAIYVQGGADASHLTDNIVIRDLCVEAISGTIDATTPMIEFGAGYHGNVFVDGLDLPVTNRATAIKTSAATLVKNLISRGERRFADGYPRDGVDFLASGEFLVGKNTGPSTYTLQASDSNLMRAVAVECCGQTMDAGGFGVSTAAVLGSATINAYVLLFADDGNGKPDLNRGPLGWTSAIDLTVTGYRSQPWAGGTNVSGGILTTPVGLAHRVSLFQITGTPTTMPLLETLTELVRHVGAVMSGTSAVTTRNQTSQAGVSAAPSSAMQFTSLTPDTTNRPAALIRKA